MEDTGYFSEPPLGSYPYRAVRIAFSYIFLSVGLSAFTTKSESQHVNYLHLSKLILSVFIQAAKLLVFQKLSRHVRLPTAQLVQPFSFWNTLECLVFWLKLLTPSYQTTLEVCGL